MTRLLLLLSLVPTLLLVACTEPEPDPSDDDDVINIGPDDDDDSVAADDDDAVADCNQPGPPYAIAFTGAVNETITFDQITCTPYGGDEYNVSLRNQTWLFRFVGGPFTTGAEVTTGIDFDLQQPSDQQTHNYGGSAGRVVLERAGDDGPLCGTFELDPLQSVNDASTVTLAGQPLPFACP